MHLVGMTYINGSQLTPLQERQSHVTRLPKQSEIHVTIWTGLLPRKMNPEYHPASSSYYQLAGKMGAEGTCWHVNHLLKQDGEELRHAGNFAGFLLRPIPPLLTETIIFRRSRQRLSRKRSIQDASVPVSGFLL